MVQQLTSDELKQKIENKESFVLDLFATWCGPCKIMLSNLEKVNESLEKENSPFKTYKFDIEQDMDLMRDWNVRGVPTIKIFKNGEETFTRAGVLQPEMVLSEIN
jgi:thioredoxin 1